MVDCTGITVERIFQECALGGDHALEIVTEDIADTSDHHQTDHDDHNAYIDHAKKTPPSVDHLLA